MVCYILGIDLGTTSVKVALIDAKTKSVFKTKCRETRASVVSDLGSVGNEQDASKIVTALQFCLSGLPKESLMKVVKIGVSGQMHGVLLWRDGEAYSRNSFGRFDLKDKVSQLFTWQDGRCSSTFLSDLPEPKSHIRLATGMGCATLFWLQRRQPQTLQLYDRAGTIQDFVVAMLTSSQKVTMSVQNAASWGYCDTSENCWNVDILSEALFPVHLLPDVVDVNSLVGHTGTSWYGIPRHTQVYVAMGDLQCCALNQLKLPNDAVLNISTSAQLAFKLSADAMPADCQAMASIIYVPFVRGSHLAVAASLNGGNVLHTFVRMLQQWTHELGLGIPEETIWGVLESCGRRSSETDLRITPTLFGERHLADCGASVANINSTNTGLGSVYRALCRSLIGNLHAMMPRHVLQAAGITRIVASGNAIAKNSLLREMIEEQYDMTVVLLGDAEADAAVGAAISLVETAGDSCVTSQDGK